MHCVRSGPVRRQQQHLAIIGDSESLAAANRAIRFAAELVDAGRAARKLVIVAAEEDPGNQGPWWTDVGARPLSLEQARAAVADLNANAELHRYPLSPSPRWPCAQCFFYSF